MNPQEFETGGLPVLLDSTHRASRPCWLNCEPTPAGQFLAGVLLLGIGWLIRRRRLGQVQLASAFGFILAAASSMGTAKASFIVNVAQVGSNVVATGVGSVNTASLYEDDTVAIYQDSIHPSSGEIELGTAPIQIGIYSNLDFSGLTVRRALATVDWATRRRVRVISLGLV